MKVLRNCRAFEYSHCLLSSVLRLGNTNFLSNNPFFIYLCVSDGVFFFFFSSDQSTRSLPQLQRKRRPQKIPYPLFQGARTQDNPLQGRGDEKRPIYFTWAYQGHRRIQDLCCSAFPQLCKFKLVLGWIGGDHEVQSWTRPHRDTYFLRSESFSCQKTIRRLRRDLRRDLQRQNGGR